MIEANVETTELHGDLIDAGLMSISAVASPKGPLLRAAMLPAITNKG